MKQTEALDWIVNSRLWVRERTRFAGEVAREVARSAGAAVIG
jgi:hypothetical protein